MTTTVDVLPKVGLLFEHAFLLDRDWTPDITRGEKYKDAPHEVCRVTKVTPWAVYYRQVGADRASTFIARDKFATVVGKLLDAQTEALLRITTEQAQLIEALVQRYLDRVPEDSPLRQLTQDLLARLQLLPDG